MLKIVLLSVFLSVGLAANISDLYGTFTSVVTLTQSATQSPTPICIKYSFAEDPSKVQCTCSDGTKPTLVEIKVLEHLQPSKPAIGPITLSGPILAVDKVEDLELSTNVTCDCAGKEYVSRGAIKTINENYTLFNVGMWRNGPRVPVTGENILLARNLPTAALLAGATTTIAEVKDRSQTVLCTQEIYETLRPKN